MIALRNGTIVVVAVILAACGGAGQKESQGPGAPEGPAGTVADGEVLIEKGDFEGAAKVFEGIVSESPDNPKAQYYLGVAKKNLGDVDSAIAHYEKAIELDGKLMDAHINLGLLLLDKGDLNRAESELGIYLAASPEVPAFGGILEIRFAKFDSSAGWDYVIFGCIERCEEAGVIALHIGFHPHSGAGCQIVLRLFNPYRVVCIHESSDV